MCMVDFDRDDFVTVIEDGHYVVARKIHKCNECRRAILPGERYHTEAYVFEGKFKRHKTCEHCMVARGWLHNECGGWLYGQVEEDIREHCHEGHYPFALYRIAVAMSQHWLTPAGDLRPVPKIPQTTHERMRA